MALRFNTKKAAEEGDEFSYVARVLTFREEDTPEDRRENCDEGSDQFRLFIQLEGVSIKWVGDEGNVRTFWAPRTTRSGEPKKGRNNKAYQILKHIIAPIDPDDAESEGFTDSDGNPEPGLGYDDAAPNFPECLEGKTIRVAHKWVTFGKDKETGEPMKSMIPAFIEELPDDYVHEGDVPSVSYGGRRTALAEEGEGTTPDQSEADYATPEEFFGAIDGQELHLQKLHEAVKDNAGLQQEPYRTLYATKQGRQALVDSGAISVDDSDPPVITVEDILDYEALETLAAEAKAAKKKGKK